MAEINWNFEKDIDVPSKSKIMYDYNAKDCEQCNPDSVCCYCKNITCYKLEEQLKAKEQECEILKEKLEKIRISVITHNECPSIACPEYDECCDKGRKYDEELLQIIEGKENG